MATKKKGSTMKTAGVKNATVITDGCNPELVKDADFDTIFEIPIIKAPEIIDTAKKPTRIALWVLLTQKQQGFSDREFGKMSFLLNHS